MAYLAYAQRGIKDEGCCCGTERGKAKNTSRASLCQGRWQNNIMLISVAGTPIKERAMITNERDDIPEDTTITGGVVVIAVIVET